MPKIRYEQRNFNQQTQFIIDRANIVLEDYAARGYDLTLRGLYYQFVARRWIDNEQKEYKRLGDIISNARLAGEIDWHHLVDRTRNLQRLPTWETPKSIIEAAAQSYREDLWEKQPVYVEVWVEKDALLGVLAQACQPWHVPYFSCRGYTSQNEMWHAAQRLRARGSGDGDSRSAATAIRHNESVVIHLGDHDPSGIDMTRDIRDRLRTLSGGDPINVDRIALTMAQIRQYNPPPNPAKVKDSRFEDYVRENHTNDSWELDALDPDVLVDLINRRIQKYLDRKRWDRDVAAMERNRRSLTRVAYHWQKVEAYANRQKEQPPDATDM